MLRDMSSKDKELLSTAMKKTSEWIFPQDIPNDVTVHVGGASFALHKLRLMSKCGYIRRLVSESGNADLTEIEIPEVPGGAEAFELAAKFCYGINFEMGTDNVAMIHCAANYLQMMEDYAVGNLVAITEVYLNEVALKSMAGATKVLRSSEAFLPVAEEVKLIGRCIDAIASLACNEWQLLISGSRIDCGCEPKPIVDWWGEDLTVLRIDTFQRVLSAMIAKGFEHYALGPILMLYAQKSLRGLEIFGKLKKKTGPRQQHESRVVLETIVSLLPREKNAMSVSFLSMLLRAAVYLETTIACRLDLEKRMGLQLGQAVLDDLLIPSYSSNGDTVFDVDTVQRIMLNYLEYEHEENRLGCHVDDDYLYHMTSDMERVGMLMEDYLSEIATDRNLSVPKFIGLAELVPKQSRTTEDGSYRAIDIYLKVHPSLSDMGRKKVCSVMDWQKLSREACAHAAQNDRLPAQTIVQVLSYEQQRLRDTRNGEKAKGMTEIPKEMKLSRLRREKEDLKIELAKMKMRPEEMEKSTTTIRSASSSPLTSVEKQPLLRKLLINSFWKKLGRIIPLNPKVRTKPPNHLRHSIS